MTKFLCRSCSTHFETNLVMSEYQTCYYCDAPGMAIVADPLHDIIGRSDDVIGFERHNYLFTPQQPLSSNQPSNEDLFAQLITQKIESNREALYDGAE